MYKFAFVGNPNAGKSTWINYLCNANMKVANYLGVSVKEETAEMVFNNEVISFIDLPGIYDLELTSAEENYTRQYLAENEVDLIVNVIDIRDIKRGLHLTAQLKHLQIPMLVLLNFVEENMNREEMEKLSELIKTPILFSTFKQKDKILATMLQVKDQPTRNTINEKQIDALKVETIKKDYRLDAFVLHPIWGIPLLIIILIGAISGIYFLSLPFSDLITYIFDGINEVWISKLDTIIYIDQLIQAIWFTLTSILSFLPFLAGIFLLLAVLEESGYIARIAYLLDNGMQLFHLSGKSVIPLLIGFGCNVPAIMATRTIRNQQERIACALMVPFISCSAKLPIFLLFTSAFFPTMQIGVLLMLYLLSVLISLFIGAFLSTKQGNEHLLVLELPSYALPSLKVVLHKTMAEIKHFLKKVSKVMIISMIILTFLFPVFQNKAYQKALTPLGFATSEEAVESIPFGLISKENLVVYYAQKKGSEPLPSYIANLWQDEHAKLRALCYLLYLAMSIPCIMTLATIKAEFGYRTLGLSIIIMFTVPYLVSLIAYQLILFLQSFF